MVVIRNADSLKRLGYEKMQAAIYIFTKQYRARGEDIKRIPTWRLMERKNGQWYLKNEATPQAREQIKNGKVIPDPSLQKIDPLYDKGANAAKEGDYKSAIKYYQKCLDLDSTYADAWFGKGTAELDDMQFDKALTDFDKALSLEPFFLQALGNRAFCRIRKHQLGDSRVLKKESYGVTVLAGKDQTPIPDDEKEKICADLKKAVLMGDKTDMVKDAIKEYCVGTGH